MDTEYVHNFNYRLPIIMGVKFFLLQFFMIISMHPSQAQPLLWDVTVIDTMDVMRKADWYCDRMPVTVTSKTMTRSGNFHNFESLSVYLWPDPDNLDGPYITRDGEINPEYKLYDLPRLSELVGSTKVLSQAFYVTGNQKYYNAFIKQIDAWFLDYDTRMTPHFEYSQFIPGRNNGRGVAAGLIDAYNFIDVIEGIRLVDYKKSIGRRRIRKLKGWFQSFAEWMMTSEMGITQSNSQNNLGAAYDVTLFCMSHFVGDYDNCDMIAANFAQRRINQQIEKDGSQPLELARTRSFHYSVFNLNHILDFCVIQQRLGNDYISAQGMRVKTAIDFLSYHLENSNDYPYQEIGDWQSLRREFYQLQKRFEQLKTDTKMGRSLPIH